MIPALTSRKLKKMTDGDIAIRFLNGNSSFCRNDGPNSPVE